MEKKKKRKRKKINVGILFNPFSGAGKSFKILKLVKENLKRDKIPFSIEIIEKNKSIKENLKNLKSKGVKKILILGGDGTLFHIANSIEKNFNIPFALFPSGSGNDFIKSLFGINKKFEFFYRVFKKGKIKKTKIGEIQEEGRKYYFTNAAGLGFDAKIAKRALKIRNLRGLLRYLISLIIELRGKISYEMEIESSKKKLEGKFLLLGFGIGKYLGGGFFLFPDASPFENKMRVCLIKDMNKLNVLRKLPHAIKGTHLRLPECIYFKTDEIHINLKDEIFLQLDGEVFKVKGKNIRIRISEKELPILHI